MIHVTIDPDKLHIRMQGHAGSVAQGNDLVCCAASTLLQAMVFSCERMRCAGACCRVKARMDWGDADVQLFPEDGCGLEAYSRFEMAADGLLLLAGNFPACVGITFA